MAVIKLLSRRFISSPMCFHVGRHRLRDRSSRVHTHQGFLEFFFVLAGRVRHRFNEEEFTLEAGTLVWVRERDTHSVVGVDRKGGQMINVAFTVKAGLEAARWLQIAPGDKVCKGPGVHTIKNFRGEQRRSFSSKLEVACAVFPDQDRLLRALLVEVLSELFPSAEQAGLKAGVSGQTIPGWLQKVCADLKQPERFIAPIHTLPTFAHKSPEHLSRSFRKYLDVTPTEYVNARRLDHAAQLLASDDEKILAIAYRCGFEQPGYFYRLFRRRFGITPLAYRRRARDVVEPSTARPN